MITPRPENAVSRRRLLTGVASGAAALAASSLLGGCGAGGSAVTRHPDAGMWRQYQGSTLNFISENTAPTAAIAANTTPFTELTGININIVTLELSALVQKVALDLASGRSTYQVIYADPYQVLAPYARGLVDLRELTPPRSSRYGSTRSCSGSSTSATRPPSGCSCWPCRS